MILVTEWLDDQGQSLLGALNLGVRYAPQLWADDRAVELQVSEASALIVRNRTQVNAALIARSPRLKVVGRLGSGLDNIDMEACYDRGIDVVYARSANAISVVEYVLQAILYDRRPWIDWSHLAKGGLWQRDLGGHEVHGQVLGIVGLGDIGARVARAAHSLGMRVVGFDPHLPPYHALVAESIVRRATSLEDLLREADYVTLHVPAKPGTHHMLNHDTLKALKPGSVIINAARGSLIDEAELLRTIRSGRVRRAFLDVRAEEPPEAQDALSQDERVIVSPHIAGLTVEAQARTSHLVIEDVLRVLGGKPPVSPAIHYPRHHG